MKLTIALGIFLTTLMTLGMSSSNTQRCCYVICLEANMIVPVKPGDGLKPASGIKLDRKTRERPERFGANGEQVRERRMSFGIDRPMPAQMLGHVMAVATEIDPELASQLSAICAADPVAFENIITLCYVCHCDNLSRHAKSEEFLLKNQMNFVLKLYNV